MKEALTQTRREVRSERISAICMAGEVWGDALRMGKAEGEGRGEDLPRANLCRKQRWLYSRSSSSSHGYICTVRGIFVGISYEVDTGNGFD